VDRAGLAGRPSTGTRYEELGLGEGEGEGPGAGGGGAADGLGVGVGVGVGLGVGAGAAWHVTDTMSVHSSLYSAPGCGIPFEAAMS
jgi:hypothetical protein